MQIVRALSKFLKWTWENTDSLTKWLQIVALAVAAYWAYTRFSIGERPSLETRVGVTTHLRAEPGPILNTCYVFLDFDLTNQGIVSFDVKNVHIRAWRSDLPKRAAELPQFIDVNDMEHSQQVVNIDSPGLLEMHFAPGESAGRSFSWVFNRQRPAFYLFRVDVEATRGKDVTHISSKSWSQDVCTEAYRRKGHSDN